MYTVYRHCKGRQHTAGGYHWKYAEEGVIAYA